jgi:hypothetical protein
VVSFTPLPLYPLGKFLRYSLDRRLGEPKSRSGRRGDEKILDPPVVQLVARGEMYEQVVRCLLI